ncbi:MAG: DNA mismatch repair protein MutS [Patescibacteria group bacterium]|nr:DNA mismatch repair protein MutS [Patescibacteria group bacterium]
MIIFSSFSFNSGGFGIEDKPLAIEVSATLLGYLKETQKGHLGHIKKISLACPNDFISLDKGTMINLELFSTLREHDPKGSLLSVLDQTKTAMGGRMLRSWLAKPLTVPEKITQRFEVVQSLLKNLNLLKEIQDRLNELPDIERVLSRLSLGIGNARDLINLKQALKKALVVKILLANLKTELTTQLIKNISADLEKVITLIDQTIADEPPVSLREGGFIKRGVNQELDNLHQIAGGGRQWVVSLEKLEKERTGINTLKVRYNKVFGFYIEVSKGSAGLVPQDYIRKQTLVNGERFITPELKEKEEKIITAEAEIYDLEYKLFQEILQQILNYTDQIQTASRAIATLDCLASFAFVSQKKRYIRPKIIYSGEIQIKAGRHPVVEDLLEGNSFVPNDVLLDQTQNQLLIITGPNMAGKSVFIRQVAIIVLMAQIGCFVPAEKAYLSLVDKIFVRSGASDMITSGLSTFMVEMMETAHILNHATKNSLIVMDEIGRGTSTYDGISIAWAVAEHLVTNLKTKTLFATHYHELQALEKEYPDKIKNFHLAVDNSQGEPIFLHTIMPGAASHSFGVAVAKLAGIPHPVVEKAMQMLHSLEKRDQNEKAKENHQLPLKEKNFPLEKGLEKIDVNKLTPLEALNLLAKLKEEIK